MKTVEFDGYEFEVPDWANYITKDPCEFYFVWSHKPVYDLRTEEYLDDYTDAGKLSCAHVEPVRSIITFTETIKEI